MNCVAAVVAGLRPANALYSSKTGRSQTGDYGCNFWRIHPGVNTAIDASRM